MVFFKGVNKTLFAICLLVFTLSLMVNCGGGGSFFSSSAVSENTYSAEVQEWLDTCPADLSKAVDWWNEIERKNWTFEHPIANLLAAVIERKLDCYWWSGLFNAKFPETEMIFVDQAGDYDHEVLRSGSPGNWIVYSCDPGKELYVDIYYFEAQNEVEFWVEMGNYFKLEKT